MKVTIVGSRKVEFADKQTGELITYMELHCVTTDKYVVGQKVLKINVGLTKAQNLDIPSDYDLNYEPGPDGKARLKSINKV